MKAKHQRLILAALAVVGVAGAGLLGASALRDEAAYFRTPAEVQAGQAVTGEAMRLGGMVQAGSIERLADGVTIRFVATDGKADLPVEFTGIVPDLFGEESGMVADGRAPMAFSSPTGFWPNMMNVICRRRWATCLKVLARLPRRREDIVRRGGWLMDIRRQAARDDLRLGGQRQLRGRTDR
jgi:cytochrome c-type biogenesis protein CcmE